MSKNLSILHILYLICLYSDLQHTFNTVRPKRFNKSLPDAYSKQGKKLFYAMGCIIHGCFKTDGDVCKPCHYLPIGTTLNDKNIYGEIYGVKKQRFDKMIAEILEKYSEIDTVELMYQCQFERDLQNKDSDVYKFFNSGDNELTPKTKPPPPFSPRAGMKVYRICSFKIKIGAKN